MHVPVWGRRSTTRQLTAGLAALAAVASGCTTDQAQDPDPPPSSVTSPSPSDHGCRTSADEAPGVGGMPEIPGRSGSEASLYALLFTPYPVPPRTEAKIAWRMTGSGAITFVAVGPGGRRVTPSWGPERHMGSNWNRPGEEWGTGFRFPVSGCWRVRATRRDDVATAGLLVG